MALVLADRVKETTSTIGTGSITLDGAVIDFQSFDSGIGDTNETYYTIVNNGKGEYEIGRGTFTSPDILSRDTVLTSSNGNALVDFSAGSKDVFVTIPAVLFQF